MIGDSEEEAVDNIQAKQEGPERTNDEGAIPRTTATLFSNPSTSTSSSSRQWSAFRNPRIVRVSKAFGGKDRHSKVCTIRGLRDRRIRLSVPTAVQLYELQDKLGLGQPSKVIDWLLDASKEDIDKLPPLQLPQGFGHHHFNPQQMLLPSFHEPGSGFLKDGMLGHSPFLTRRHGININESYASIDHHEGEPISPHDRAEGDSLTYSTHLHLGGYRMTQESSEIVGRDSGKGKWVETIEGQSYGGAADCSNPSNSSQQAQVSAQNFFPIVSYSLGGLPPVNPMLPYSGYSAQWEPSSLSLSHFGSQGLQFQSETPLGSNAVSVAAPHVSSSTSGLPPNSQLYFCSPAAATPRFPPYPQQMEHHHLQMPSSLMPSGLHLIGSSTKPFQANVDPKYFHREDRNDDDDEDDDRD